MKLNKIVLQTVGILLFITACANSPEHPSLNDRGFILRLEKSAEKIKANSQYIRIPINTDLQTDQFLDLSHKLYNGEISKNEYIRIMSNIYPGFEESIKWNADQFAN